MGSIAARMGRVGLKEQQEAKLIGLGDQGGPEDELEDIKLGLPEGWDAMRNGEGKIFFIDHTNKVLLWAVGADCQSNVSLRLNGHLPS